MWLAWCVEPHGSAYHTAYAWHVQGKLDTNALRSCFSTLQSRHELLRTTYFFADGQPWQRVRDHMPLDFAVCDVTALAAGELARRIDRAIRQPFDLEQGPVARIRIYQTGPSSFRLVVTLHHIAADLWSARLLHEELWKLYLATTTGLACELPAAGPRYVDYTRQHQQMLQGDEGKKLQDYWQCKLAGDLPVLHMPGDLWDSGQRRFSGATCQRAIGRELTEIAKHFCRQQRVTLFAALLSAYQVLLQKHSHQRDALVGIVTMGWRRHAFRTTVGNFINVLPLRTHLPTAPRLPALATAVNQAVAEAMRHQGLPFALMVQAAARGRIQGRTPLVQNVFIFHGQTLRAADHALARLGEQGLSIQPELLPQQEGQFELAVQICDTDAGLAVDWRYDSGCIDHDVAMDLARDYERVLTVLIHADCSSVG